VIASSDSRLTRFAVEQGRGESVERRSKRVLNGGVLERQGAAIGQRRGSAPGRVRPRRE
jgi:hypothetical protein